MKCPKCDEKMSPTNASEILIHNCMYCEGVWVTEKALGILLKMENESSTPQQLMKQVTVNKITELNCPTCKNHHLIAINTNDIELDSCDNCYGIFFDKGELKEVLPTKHKFVNPIDKEAFILEALFWLFIGLGS